MTAIGVLKIYSIILFVMMILYNLSLTVRTYKKTGFIGGLMGLLSGGLISAVFGLIIFGLGYGFMFLSKWILAQFGIVAANDMVYAVIYILLTLFGGVGTRTYF